MTADTRKADLAGSTKTAKQKGNGAIFPGVIFSDGIMGPLSHAGRYYLYTVAALNDAAAQMASEHTSANMEAARTLPQCHDLGEAMQVQSQLLKSTGEACIHGWSRWIESSNQYMSEIFGQTGR